MPKISVIVPIYKAEDSLERCVDSILGQTFKDFELILIDDGSPDRCNIICDKYAEKDTRIKVIHKQNGGVSSARNAGIKAAKGKWITFVDSDDYVEKNFLKDLYEPEYDLTVIGHKHINAWQGNMFINSIKSYATEMLDGFGLNKVLEDNGTYWMMFCWGRLYRSDIIHNNNLSFTQGMNCGEDYIFSTMYLALCKSLLLKEETSYVHVASDSGTLSTTFDISFFENIQKAEAQVAKIIESRFSIVYPQKTDEEKRKIYADCLGSVALDEQFTFWDKYKIFRYVYQLELFQAVLNTPEKYYYDASKVYRCLVKLKSPFIMLLALTIKQRLSKMH